MERVLSVDSVYGSPARAAARATASSPSGSAMRVKPVGARTSGYASGCPRSVESMSTLLDAAQHAGPEGGVGERGLVGGEGALVFRAAVDVVEHAAGQAPLGDAAKVGDRGGAGQAPLDAVGLDRLEAHDRAQGLVRVHTFSPGRSLACSIQDRSCASSSSSSSWMSR